MTRICCFLFIIFTLSLFLYEGSQGLTTNVALGKSIMQSSDGGVDFKSHLVIDGDTRQFLPTGGITGLCTHTATTPNEWWIVDLGVLFDIYNILIYGRGDCCSDRLQDFDVDVIAPVRLHDNLTMSTIGQGRVTFRYHVRPPTTYTKIDCPSNTHGQFVRIRHRGTRILSLCEVEIYGKPATCLKASDVSRHDQFPSSRYTGEVIQTQSAKSPAHCMAICKNVHCCYSANFNMETKRCEMRKKIKSTGQPGCVSDKTWTAVLLY